ncbi:hypothetical protein K461DRAFT_270104 [Myriangium duriaei CBS 260.36]|uniref:SAP domain-containing protein n=1 Tax=Myriangium duriaei CBS 260.36 TaxID=1168546 RepID=A0A9P4J1J3_9PEZI|nr:hypothetical protein K461DRAFT_270104 [Myriangium duriaei CBS 260.36]
MDCSSSELNELKDELEKRGIVAPELSRKQDYIQLLQVDDNDTSKAKDTIKENASLLDSLDKPELTIDAAASDTTNPHVEQNLAEDTVAGVHDEPCSKSILQNSPRQTYEESTTMSAGQIRDDLAKRKRRSLSPAMSDSSVTKKLKTAEEDPVYLEEDATHLERGLLQDDTPPPQVQSQGTDLRIVDSKSTMRSSIHPPTSALYIKNLVRPITVDRLRSHLESMSDATTPIIETFHLDALRTHAFVVFTSTLIANRIRSRIHDVIFPMEPGRKPLWVDFVPPTSVPVWIRTEAITHRHARMKRFEVHYSTTSSGSVLARLVEAPDTERKFSTAPPAPRTSFSGPAAATAGPSAARDNPRPLTLSPTTHISFPLTRTEPALYYSPVSPSLADSRLRTLDNKTSSSWDAQKDHVRFVRRNSFRTLAAGREDQLRRYTFEDGTHLVDGGVEYGGGAAFNHNRSNGNGSGRKQRRPGPPRGDRYIPSAGDNARAQRDRSRDRGRDYSDDNGHGYRRGSGREYRDRGGYDYRSDERQDYHSDNTRNYRFDNRHDYHPDDKRDYRSDDKRAYRRRNDQGKRPRDRYHD